MKGVFKCQRFGIGGIVNSDCIQSQPYFTMVSTLTFIYASANVEKRTKIEEFIKDNYLYSDWSIETILGFNSNTKNIGNWRYSIDCSNGREAIESLICKFNDICKLP